MKGFDPRWKDFPDYIISITKEIWEDRGLATLHDYYGKDIVVRTPGSVATGNEGVIAATAGVLAEFPDRRLLGQDVIWSGSPEDGMLSSHRILSTATHSRDGVYGKASGTKLVYRIIADCYAIDNAITDEWLVRDQGAIVRQLGWDPMDYARDLIEKEGGPDACTKPFTPAIDLEGPYKGRGNDNEWGQKYADILTRIMSADLRCITSEYDRAVIGEYPGGVTAISHDGVDAFWIGLKSAMPNATFNIEHMIGRDDPMMPPRAAIRWSLDGKHEGWGAFGKPSGANIHIMGISHAEFGPWGLRREYTLFDETAIYKQIALHLG